ncbi:hypothetical protein SBOR_6735 [Sclerotinia borealis F-4128]|uniref:Peptidyl-tRNA hydrolase n=1 Tax=Sclerotinia borealis (strain F-4128) TaxID=1432307 RepID=W9C814_SCLBF|nr:hypothetical protein SBOR_6735 [Sclerotinia borealis F-4128]
MRISTISLLALPLLVSAQESPLDQAKAQAQYWFGKLQSYIPSPSSTTPLETSVLKVGSAKIHHLTLDTWHDTIRGSVNPESSSLPQEWWVLTTGGNKTCFGLCDNVERAFNESAAIFSLDSTAPDLAILNCDEQPVLCNSWGAGPPHLWTMEVGVPGSPVPIITLPLNTTTTNVNTFTNLHATKSYKKKAPYEGWFHPFDGPLAQYGAAVPAGYVLWFFSVVPSWMFMIGISFVSRTIMSKRTQGPGAAAAAAARPRAAPAGDGVAY